MHLEETGNKSKSFFSVDDLALIRSVSEPRLSPDGLFVTCVIAEIDQQTDRSTGHIVLINCRTRECEAIGEGSGPQWSPEGDRIAYLAENGQSAYGIWVYNVSDKSRNWLTPIHESGYFINHLANKNFAWSPDGRYIAFP